jgi:hypothetical protein
LSKTAGAFVIGLTLLVGGFVLNSPIDPMTVTLAQEANSDTTASVTISNTTTSGATSLLRMKLSQDLVYQEQEKLVSQIPINQIHVELIVSKWNNDFAK